MSKKKKTVNNKELKVSLSFHITPSLFLTHLKTYGSMQTEPVISKIKTKDKHKQYKSLRERKGGLNN